MKKILHLVLLAAVIAGTALLQGCATKIKASSVDNPPPAQAFSHYGRIEVEHAVFNSGVTGNTAALAKIDENIQKDLREKLAAWNARPDNGRKLIIRPVVDELSFKSGAKRVFLGPLAGSSGVLMHLVITDANGSAIAQPEFFQRAAAMGAGFTLGVHDNLMLTRVANLASGYVIGNFEKAVGGLTGADGKSIAPKN
jgi:hypothetical protein